MKKIFSLATMFVLTMCVANGVFAQDNTMKPGDGKMMNSKGNSLDAKFMMMAAMSDMNEIGLSNMALQKSTNDDVKKMAQMMVDDHTKASDELKPIAMSKNVMLPTSADAKHMAMMTKLQAMSGAEFDMMYIKAMVKDHEKAVKMFQKESMSGKDADAKAFAAKTLPTLQMHLTMANEMMGKMMNMKSSDKMKSDSNGNMKDSM